MLRLAFATAINLIGKSDCKACHNVNTKSLGPSFTQVALKYKGDNKAEERLSRKIISGGSGVWGDAAMPAHPSITESNASTIVRYILSLSEKQTVKSRPVQGSYVLDTAIKADKGNLIFRAAYTDKGTRTAAAQLAEDVVVLRSALVPVANMELDDNIEFTPGRTRAMAKGPEAYLGLKNIDLTAISEIEFAASAFGGIGPGVGGTIEIHLDLPNGPLAGSTPEITPPQPGGNRRGGRGGRVKAGITNVAGIHDLYFVIKNEKAKSTDVLISVADIKFTRKP